MSDKPHAAVVILNFNGHYFLERFLPGIITHSMPYPVIVADNGSSDRSLQLLAHRFPTVRVIENKGNFGYAGGYNMALKQVEAECYILLNSDVEVTEKWIEPVLALLEKHPDIAACQPKVLNEAQRDHFEYAGAAGGFIDSLGYPFCRGRIFNSLEADRGQFDDAREVFWATGACLFVRSSAFWQVDGLDEDYFAHMEEIDLCWRLKNRGHRIFVEPASVIFHVGGGTLNKSSSQKTFLNFRNNLTTLAKNHPPRGLFFKILYRLVLDGIAAFKFLGDGQPRHFWAVLRAHFAFYSRIPSLLKKRKAQKKLSGFRFSTSQVYRGNTVADYFIKGRRKFGELQKGFFTD